MNVSLENIIEKSNEKPVIVDFYADWCGPCKMLSPVLDKIEKEEDIVVARVDVDKNQSLAQKHGVRSIPTVKLFKGGKEVDTFIGFRDKNQIKEWINNHA